MKIAVWSPTPFAGRKSTHLLLFALQAITEEGGEQLVLHTDPEGSGPAHFLLSGIHRKRMMEQNEFGVEFLGRVLRCERFSKELAVNAAYTFAEGKLHVLPAGSRSFYRETPINAAEAVCRMMRAAEAVFQNVWVELPAGESLFSEKVLQEVDCIIVNLAQSPCEVVKASGFPEPASSFYLLGAYEQQNIFSAHNLTRLAPELSGKCAAIPYNPGFLAACCEGEAEQFWVRSVKLKERTEYATFYRAVEKAYRKWKERSVRSNVGKEKEDRASGV